MVSLKVFEDVEFKMMMGLFNRSSDLKGHALVIIMRKISLIILKIIFTSHKKRPD